jgi:hypothetical protein
MIMPHDDLKALRISLIAFGIAFLMVYPLMIVWPSGWAWQPGQREYEQMIVGIYATLGFFLLWGFAETRSAPEPDLVHGLVERRARRHHGRAGHRRSRGAWPPARRCRGAAARGGRSRSANAARRGTRFPTSNSDTSWTLARSVTELPSGGIFPLA